MDKQQHITSEIQTQPKITSVAQLVHNETFLKRANDVLGGGTQQFMSSVLSLANSNPSLQKCDPIKLYNACLMSAAIKLPFNQNLGQAFIIAYKGEPQLQIGWKGFVQLAQRSGQFRTINVTDVREGEIKHHDRLTGEMEFEWMEDEGVRSDLPVIGYVAFFELLNGFQKMYFMSVVELQAHAKRYSQTYQKGHGVWKDNFDAMARKTVLKLMLNKFAPLSIDMQKAIDLDQSNGQGEYIDNKRNIRVDDAKLGESEEDRIANTEEAEIITE